MERGKEGSENSTTSQSRDEEETEIKIEKHEEPVKEKELGSKAVFDDEYLLKKKAEMKSQFRNGVTFE